MIAKIYGREVTAIELSPDEFEEIKWKRDTPDFVISGGVGYYNSYTCLSGYSGTCNCFTHPRKEWTKFNPVTGEILGKE